MYSVLKKIILIIILLFVFTKGNLTFAQQKFLSLNKDLEFIFEDEIYGDTNNFHTSIKPYKILDIKNYQSIFQELETKKTLFDNYFFSKKFNNNEIAISPILLSEVNYKTEEKSTMSWGGGIRTEGNFGSKLSFKFDFTYLNFKYPDFLKQNIEKNKILPHFDKYNSQNSDFFSTTNFRGYVSYSPSQYFNFQLGKDKNFFGDGFRSLLLSDNAASYPFLKMTIDIWKFKYVCLYTKLQDVDLKGDNFDFHDKYATFHYLSTNIGKRLNISLFEVVIWNATDSIGADRGFDFNYLNPVIFMRPVEFSIGSPDNEILGIAGRYRLGNNTNLYFQFALDEFVLREVKAGNDWWANKYGIQIGVKSFNFLNINNLQLQTEFNYLRPFTYSHTTSLQNFGHQYQPLAHPLGANLYEAIAILHYKKNRFNFAFVNSYIKYGTDMEGENYGQNIYKSYHNRTKEYGNKTGQGVENKLIKTNLKIGYWLNPQIDLLIEANLGLQIHSIKGVKNKDFFAGISLKTAIYSIGEIFE